MSFESFTLGFGVGFLAAMLAACAIVSTVRGTRWRPVISAECESTEDNSSDVTADDHALSEEDMRKAIVERARRDPKNRTMWD